MARLDTERLGSITTELRTHLAQFGTADVTSKLAVVLKDYVNDVGDTSRQQNEATLSSPARQAHFAMSLLMSTPEPAEQRELDAASWARCVALLEQIGPQYAASYFPEATEELTDEWRRNRFVAMSAYLHHFNTDWIASTEQLEARIIRYLVPFDPELTLAAGLSATDGVRIVQFLLRQTQAAWDSVALLAHEERRRRLDFLARWEEARWDPDEARAQVTEDDRELATALIERCAAIQRVELSALQQEFGMHGDAYWKLFSVARGQASPITYFTEHLPFEETPLALVEPNVAYFVSTHHLYAALLDVLERRLSSGSTKERYFKVRDRLIEDEVAGIFHRLLPGAVVMRSVFETPDQRWEHDIVVSYQDVCIVVEVKASPPAEPFRDPDKAFERISRLFKSDKGIQKAYEQCLRLWLPWSRGETVRLYDSHGQQVWVLERASAKKVMLVCVTRDDFGALATDLTMLLKKEPASAPYPWAPNVLSLDFLADCWPRLGLGPRQFIEFLEHRVRLHGIILTTDELEIAGYFVRHGGFQRLLRHRNARVQLDPAYSNVFDRVFLEKHGREPAPIRQSPPVERDMSELFGRVQADDDAQVQSPKHARNAPCVCGSGRKYKHCCGRS